MLHLLVDLAPHPQPGPVKDELAFLRHRDEKPYKRGKAGVCEENCKERRCYREEKPVFVKRTARKGGVCEENCKERRCL